LASGWPQTERDSNKTSKKAKQGFLAMAVTPESLLTTRHIICLRLVKPD